MKKKIELFLTKHFALMKWKRLRWSVFSNKRNLHIHIWRYSFFISI